MSMVLSIGSPYYKMRLVLLQNGTAILLLNATKVDYKMRQVFYYETRQFYTKYVGAPVKDTQY